MYSSYRQFSTATVRHWLTMLASPLSHSQLAALKHTLTGVTSLGNVRSMQLLIFFLLQHNNNNYYPWVMTLALQHAKLLYIYFLPFSVVNFQYDVRMINFSYFQQDSLDSVRYKGTQTVPWWSLAQHVSLPNMPKALLERAKFQYQLRTSIQHYVHRMIALGWSLYKRGGGALQNLMVSL